MLTAVNGSSPKILLDRSKVAPSDNMVIPINDIKTLSNMLNVLPYHVIFGAAELADGLELLIELDFLLKIVISIITY